MHAISLAKNVAVCNDETMHRSLKIAREFPGLSMIEVLAVTAIMGVLLVSGLIYIRPQVNKGYDGRRKADLQKIATALESYNNDKGGFPGTTLMGVCGQANTALKNYMRGGVPCDPRTNQPYVYEARDGNSSCAAAVCPNYQIYTILENDADPDIERVCGTNGCYPGQDFNYGIGGGVIPDRSP